MADANLEKLFATTGRLETISNMKAKHLPNGQKYSEENFLELQRAAILILSCDGYTKKEAELNAAYEKLSAKGLSANQITIKREEFYKAYDDCVTKAKEIAEVDYGFEGEQEQNSIVAILNLSRDRLFQEEIKKQAEPLHKTKDAKKPHELKPEKEKTRSKVFSISQVA